MRPSPKFEARVNSAMRGNRRALARLLSIAENDALSASRISTELTKKGVRAHVVGVTGPPGCGKSTLIASLTAQLRKNAKRVGIIAIDPSSAFSGGALLGDRVRMLGLSQDPEVFIRSFATRGEAGGLARVTDVAVQALALWSRNYVLVETTGAGQSDIDIRRIAHTVAVVTAPGLGDDVQAYKAGLMEIGDIFIVNMADREGADKTLAQIRSMLRSRPNRQDWDPPVLKSVGTRGEGIRELVKAIDDHENFLAQHSNMESRTSKATEIIKRSLSKGFEDLYLPGIQASQRFERLSQKVAKGQIPATKAAQELLRKFLPPRELKSSRRKRK